MIENIIGLLPCAGTADFIKRCPWFKPEKNVIYTESYNEYITIECTK